MRAYTEVVRNNKVVFHEKPDLQEGADVLVIAKPSDIEDERITERQLKLLATGFKMGRVLHSFREDIHKRQ